MNISRFLDGFQNVANDWSVQTEKFLNDAETKLKFETEHLFSDLLERGPTKPGIPTQDLKAYQYSRLRADQIRVLHIEPSKRFDDPLICRLETTTIATDYHIALSYAWGISEPTDVIQIDNQSLKITLHLHQALRRVRQNARQLYLFQRTIRIWVDFICINQLDLAERSQQVTRMGDIYLRCDTLVIWLGEIDTDDHHRKTLHKLLSYSWFQRRWVIQEYTLAPSGRRYFLQGSNLLDAERLYGTLKASGLLSQAGPMQDVDRPITGLLDLLHRYDDACCSVDHDRVYAFISINSIREEVAASEIVVDYKQSVDDLFVTVATTEVRLRSRNVAGLLPSAALRGHGSSATPSWVPDWRVRPRGAFAEAYEALERCFSEERGSVIGQTHESTLSLRDMPLVNPCFPPRHTSARGCVCCTMFAKDYISWSITMKRVVESCRVVFLLSEEDQHYRLHQCFPISIDTVLPNLANYRKSCIPIE